MSVLTAPFQVYVPTDSRFHLKSVKQYIVSVLLFYCTSDNYKFVLVKS